MVALTLPCLNCSCMLPDGTPASSNWPRMSTAVVRFVPTTVTVMPDGAAAPVPRAAADAVENVMLPPFTVPVIVAPVAPVDPDGPVGPETRPPQPAAAPSARHQAGIRGGGDRRRHSS